MENTTQSKSRFFLGILLSPITLIVLIFFSLYSLKHRKQYKGSEEYSSRFFFMKKIFWLIYQLIPQEDILEDKEELNFKNSLIVLYGSSFSFFSIYISFLLSDFYQKNYQIKKAFKLCILHSQNFWWEFFLSSLEIFRKIPPRNFLKESDESIIYFSNSISSLKKIIKHSYRTVIFFKQNTSFSWNKGFKRIYIAIGKVTLKERLKNLEEFNLKLNKIFSSLEQKS